MYLAAAEQQGADWTRPSGTSQNDIFQRVHRAKGVSVSAALRVTLPLVTDTIEFATGTHVQRFNPISISGYHIREGGSTAAHRRLAFTLRDGIEYLWTGRWSVPAD